MRKFLFPLLILWCAFMACAQTAFAEANGLYTNLSLSDELTSIHSDTNNGTNANIQTESYSSENKTDTYAYSYDSSNLRKGWNVDVQLGASAFMGSPLGCGTFTSKIKPFLRAHIGKWFTSSVGSRLSWECSTMKAADMDKQRYQAFHMDFLWNLATMMTDKDNFILAPYFGTGCVWNQTIGHAPMALSYGVVSSVKVSRHFSAILEFGALSTFKYFDGVTCSGNGPLCDYRFPRLGDNLFNLTIGLSYTLPSEKKSNRKGRYNGRIDGCYTTCSKDNYVDPREENALNGLDVSLANLDSSTLEDNELKPNNEWVNSLGDRLYTTEELLILAELSNQAKKLEEEKKAEKLAENEIAYVLGEEPESKGGYFGNPNDHDKFNGYEMLPTAMKDDEGYSYNEDEPMWSELPSDEEESRESKGDSRSILSLSDYEDEQESEGMGQLSGKLIEDENLVSQDDRMWVEPWKEESFESEEDKMLSGNLNNNEGTSESEAGKTLSGLTKEGEDNQESEKRNMFSDQLNYDEDTVTVEDRRLSESCSEDDPIELEEDDTLLELLNDEEDSESNGYDMLSSLLNDNDESTEANGCKRTSLSSNDEELITQSEGDYHLPELLTWDEECPLSEEDNEDSEFLEKDEDLIELEGVSAFSDLSDDEDIISELDYSYSSEDSNSSEESSLSKEADNGCEPLESETIYAAESLEPNTSEEEYSEEQANTQELGKPYSVESEIYQPSFEIDPMGLNRDVEESEYDPKSEELDDMEDRTHCGVTEEDHAGDFMSLGDNIPDDDVEETCHSMVAPDYGATTQQTNPSDAPNDLGSFALNPTTPTKEISPKDVTEEDDNKGVSCEDNGQCPRMSLAENPCKDSAEFTCVRDSVRIVYANRIPLSKELEWEIKDVYDQLVELKTTEKGFPVREYDFPSTGDQCLDENLRLNLVIDDYVELTDRLMEMVRLGMNSKTTSPYLWIKDPVTGKEYNSSYTEDKEEVKVTQNREYYKNINGYYVPVEELMLDSKGKEINSFEEHSSDYNHTNATTNLNTDSRSSSMIDGNSTSRNETVSNASDDRTDKSSTSETNTDEDGTLNQVKPKKRHIEATFNIIYFKDRKR